ncbi:MAG: response regulator [Rhodobacteraceae bacterium]|nr:response regulator [Paracoccaceae bacterium]
MTESRAEENPSLAAFEVRNSPEGLLRRYARGRVRHFAARQIATVSGAIALWMLVSPGAALLVTVLAIGGELLDCGLLARVPALLARGVPVHRLLALTTFTAGIQGLTIAATVLIAQSTALEGEASLFSFAFLLAAVLNAGVVRRYHPQAANVRIAIFAVTGVAGYALEDMFDESVEGLIYNAFGLAMLGFIAFVFLRFVDRAERRRTEDSRRLLVGQEALERANSDLRESQAEARQLALVARHANDSFMLLDNALRIIWVNEGFTRMKGFHADEVMGRTPVEVLAGPDSDLEALTEISRSALAGEPLRKEILNYTKDGRQIWVEAVFAPMFDASGTVEKVIVTERDITDARLRAIELADAKERAESGARAKAAFLATMSHEIRTPMNGIIGMADLLSDGALSEDQQLYVATIRTSAEALLKIINDILDYSKLEADKFAIVAEPFSLAACIRDAAGILRPQALEKGLFLDICHERPLPDSVLGDSGRLRQILINLLGNAVKFTATGGVTLTTRVEDDDAGVALTVTVQDSGIGVAPDRAERIFDQFEQADAETTRRFGGTGLGLAISRELAVRMGGGLRLVEGRGPGACFELTLRLAKAGAEPAAPNVRTPPDEQLQPFRLLLAEDNGTNRLLVKRFLEGHMIAITEALNGRDAVERVRIDQPDVVLMDMSMPVLDGLAATRAIRASDQPQPWIIALTANAFDSDREACLATGMDDFLGKPLRKSALLAALARAQRHWTGEKALGPPAQDAVSGGSTPSDEASQWKSPPESGTTSGRSIRSSAR